MDAAEVQAHIDLVRMLSRKDGPLSAGSSTATTRNPEWFQDGKYLTLERLKLHRSLLFEQARLAADVGANHRAIILAGPPGAGKSSLVAATLQDESDGYLVIDADAFKVALLQEAIRDGSYEGFIKPREVIDLEGQGHRFFPLELSSLVHEESSLLAQGLRTQAMESGSNMVIDTVLANAGSAQRLVRQLDDHGYDIRIIDVEASMGISKARVTKRWVQAYELALETGEGFGGRWVPSEYIRGVFNADGKAVSAHIARMIADSCPVVSRYQLFKTTSSTTGPVLEADLSRTGTDGVLRTPQKGEVP
ncbi:MAG: zeta toxin family protein [Coriobacteriales bacterium]|nr:zeta toxin family protein [Coriobacteriales bacterium]